MGEDTKLGLENLSPAEGSRTARKRVGRGHGSGSGKTSGRGHKGQKSRSGASIPAWFEGGQMPLYRRIPKRGFKPLNRTRYQTVNLRDLARLEETAIGPEELAAHGMFSATKGPLKVLGYGDFDRAVTVRAHAFSASAREKIQAAGGTAELID